MICLAIKKHKSQTNSDCITSFHYTFEASGVKKGFIIQVFPLWLDKRGNVAFIYKAVKFRFPNFGGLFVKE